MGSIGASQTTSTSFAGKSVQDLFEAAGTHKSLRDTFNLQNVSDTQLSMLYRILRGINEYDRYYDEDKTPYNISLMTIKEMGSSKTPEEIERDRELGIRQSKPDIYIDIYAEPNIDNAYIRMLDEKHHHAIIGPRGGLYTYLNGGKRTSLDLYKVQRGERSGL